MYAQATISCECGCIFESEFQNSDLNKPPKCPMCGKVMNKTSWQSLRDVMAEVCDLNHHIFKWHLERDEPLMQVPAITVRSVKNQADPDESSQS